MNDGFCSQQRQGSSKANHPSTVIIMKVMQKVVSTLLRTYSNIIKNSTTVLLSDSN